MTTETVAAAPVAPAEKPEPRFTATRNIRGVDDATRDLLLADVASFHAYGIRGQRVIFRTDRGFTMCEPREIQGHTLIFFDHCPADGSARNVFWVERDAVAFLSEAMRFRKATRCPFESIFQDANG
jgi:hypothetical protein